MSDKPTFDRWWNDFGSNEYDASDHGTIRTGWWACMAYRVVPLERENAALRERIAEQGTRETGEGEAMTLGPRTLKSIAEGPRKTPLVHNGCTIDHIVETPEDFARRVAMIAAEEERERAIRQHDESACAAEIADLKARLEQERDIRIDREVVIDSIAESLKVEFEPHQSFFERLCDAAAIREGR